MFEFFDLFIGLMPTFQKIVADAKAKDIPKGIEDACDGGKIVAAWLRKRSGDKPLMGSIVVDEDVIRSTLDSVSSDGGFLKRIARRRLLKTVKDRVRDELKTRGFTLVADELAANGIVMGGTPKKYKDADVDAMWAKAEEEGGLSDDAILEYADRPEVGAFGDGRFIQILQNIIQWISDHQDQILAVIKFVMMLLAMFGL